MGILLAEGIGDTIRVSLATSDPREEIRVAHEILKTLAFRNESATLVACPTCGAAAGLWCWQGVPTANGKRVLIHDTRKVAAGKLGEIGWHTFRHTYRSWLDENRSADEGAAGTDASCLDPDDHECLWTGYDIVQTRSEWEVVEMVLKPVKASA